MTAQLMILAHTKLETWNQRLLDDLKKNKLKTILFSAGANKSSPKGKYVLNSWNDAGHLIANHTVSHVNFNSKQVSLEDFKLELTKNDSLIKGLHPLHPLLSISLPQRRGYQRKSRGVQNLSEAERLEKWPRYH